MRKSKQLFLVFRLLELFYGNHALLDRLFVDRDEVCIACRDALCESLVDVLERYDRLHLEICSHDSHVVYLRVSYLCGNVNCINPADLDVGSGRRIDDSVRVVDEKSSRFHSALELVERLLVEDDCCIVLRHDR